jgi:hypothetical protein
MNFAGMLNFSLCTVDFNLKNGKERSSLGEVQPLYVSTQIIYFNITIPRPKKSRSDQLLVYLKDALRPERFFHLILQKNVTDVQVEEFITTPPQSQILILAIVNNNRWSTPSSHNFSLPVIINSLRSLLPSKRSQSLTLRSLSCSDL